MPTTVQSLRQSGNKVRVNHLRRYFDSVNKRWCFLTDYDRALSALPSHVKPSEYGGETRIDITTPFGVTIQGVTRCSKKDVFVRKEGVKYAIADAFHATLNTLKPVETVRPIVF